MYINIIKGAATDCGLIGTRTPKGLSAVELLVILALTGLLAGTAVPAFQGAVEKKNLSNGVERVSLFLNSVMSEAVQRNRHASVSYQVRHDGRWCVGAILQRSPCDCMETDPTEPEFCRLDSSDWVLRGSDLQIGDLLIPDESNGHFVLDPVRRMPIGSRDAMVLGLQSENQTYRVQLRLFANGRISVCQAQASKNIGPYKSCAQSGQ